MSPAPVSPAVQKWAPAAALHPLRVANFANAIIRHPYMTVSTTLIHALLARTSAFATIANTLAPQFANRDTTAVLAIATAPSSPSRHGLECRRNWVVLIIFSSPFTTPDHVLSSSFASRIPASPVDIHCGIRVAALGIARAQRGLIQAILLLLIDAIKYPLLLMELVGESEVVRMMGRPLRLMVLVVRMRIERVLLILVVAMLMLIMSVVRMLLQIHEPHAFIEGDERRSWVQYRPVRSLFPLCARWRPSRHLPSAHPPWATPLFEMSQRVIFLLVTRRRLLVYRGRRSR